MSEGVFAIVHAIEEKRVGSDLESAAAPGATQLVLEDADWASEQGGKLYVGGVHPVDSDVFVTYSGVNYSTNTLTGVSGISYNWDEGTIVEPRPRQWLKYAEVWPEGIEDEDDPDPVVCRVHNSLVDRLFRGTREPDTGERVFIEKRGPEYVLYEIIGEQGDALIWQYTSKEDIVTSTGVSFSPPYPALMKEARILIEGAGTGNSNFQLQRVDDGSGIVSFSILAGENRSPWKKTDMATDHEGYELDDDMRIRAVCTILGADVVGPFQLQIKVVPKGQG